MTVLIAILLTFVAIAATVVVATNAPERQAVSLAVFGLAMTLLFFVLQAPDVALSQVGVGAALVPLMVMLAVRTMRRDRERGRGKDGS